VTEIGQLIVRKLSMYDNCDR